MKKQDKRFPLALNDLTKIKSHQEYASAFSNSSLKVQRKTFALPESHLLTSNKVRERMVERLQKGGITQAQVLAAMQMIPRHLFVDPGLASQAYEEIALPIGHQQTISKPFVVARMIEFALKFGRLNRVLEVGTGCGYQAAVLAKIAKEVYSIERIKPLFERAKLNLRPLSIPNIRLHYGDGCQGLPEVGSFDAILIAAAGLKIPQALLAQLSIGGCLIAPVEEKEENVQFLTVVERVEVNRWLTSKFDRVFFVPLKSGTV